MSDWGRLPCKETRGHAVAKGPRNENSSVREGWGQSQPLGGAGDAIALGTNLGEAAAEGCLEVGALSSPPLSLPGRWDTRSPLVVLDLQHHAQCRRARVMRTACLPCLPGPAMHRLEVGQAFQSLVFSPCPSPSLKVEKHQGCIPAYLVGRNQR